jgi:FkbM family methyltransferase
MWMRLALPDEARYWRGEHDPDVQCALKAAVREGNVIYDIGAHLGYFALGAARLAGESGCVVAFDGDPDNAARLQENAAHNHLEGRFQVVHAAVWSSSVSDRIPFRRGIEPRAHGGVESNGHRPVLGSGDLITVPMITLDEFTAQGGPLPHVVKIDVEGGEGEVLRGGACLFARQRPIVIAEVHHERAAEQIRLWLVEQRYCAQWNVAQSIYPRQLFAWPEEFDGTGWMRRFQRTRVPKS